MLAAITIDLVRVYGEYFDYREVVRHLASFVYRGPYFSWLER